jgi:transposase
MLSFAGSLKVFLAVEPCDMRKGFNGLPSLVSERLQENPQAGAMNFQSFPTLCAGMRFRLIHL